MAKIQGTVLQGGADAYAQAVMNTALLGQTTQAYRVNQITFEFILPAVPAFPYAAALTDLSLALTRRTKTAMPNISDNDVIKKWKWSEAFLTAVGAGPTFLAADIWTPNGDVFIVEDPLYLQIDSTATGQVWSAVIDIDFDIVQISQVDRLTLLTQSLD